MDEELDDLARTMMPLIDLRTVSGDPCTVAETWDGLFGDGNPECFINAQVGSKYDTKPLCFPAGAQLRGGGMAGSGGPTGGFAHARYVGVPTTTAL